MSKQRSTLLRKMATLSNEFIVKFRPFDNFSERELMFRFAICYRRFVCLSVVCLWLWCSLFSRLKFSAIFLRPLVPWPSIDIHWKFYGYRPKGTPPSGDLNARGVVKYSDFDIWNAITSKRCNIGGRLVLITNTKSYMGFRLVPKLVTLNDFERRNGPYFALFYRIW